MKKNLYFIVFTFISYFSFSQEIEQKFEFYFRLDKTISSPKEIKALYANYTNVENVEINNNEIKVTALCNNFKQQDSIIKPLKDWVIKQQIDIVEYRKENLSIPKQATSNKKR